jgi:glycerol-3-phosphate acyltransferase PlsY
MTFAALVVGGYVCGSMPFGYWIVRLFKGADIRRMGSGNIGATNVWRAYGPAYGAPVMVLDIAKGFVPALTATLIAGHLAGALAGGAAMLGHWRPLFLGFARGGKTVATCAGVFLGIAPLVFLLGSVLWIIVFLLTRYASVASIVGTSAMPVFAVVLDEPWPVIVFATLAALAVILLHRPNIARLRAGTENKVSLRRPKRDGGEPVGASR